jgi:hypothetical protein
MYIDDTLYEIKQLLEEQKLNSKLRGGEVESLSGNSEESNESWVDVVGSPKHVKLPQPYKLWG